MKKAPAISLATCLISAVILLSASLASADVLSIWDIAAREKNADLLPASYTGDYILASSISASNIHLLNGKDSVGNFSAKHWSLSESTSANDYYQFSISLDENSDTAAIQLTQLIAPLARESYVMDLMRGAENWKLYASYDNFAYDSTLVTSASIAESGGGEITPVSFDLDGWTLTAGQTLTLRLSGYGGTFWNAYAGLYAGDTPATSQLKIEGQYLAVPEPATASLLLAGLTAILMRKRRRRNAATKDQQPDQHQ